MEDNKEKSSPANGEGRELNEKDLAGVTGGVNETDGVCKIMKVQGKLRENYECPFCHNVNSVYILGAFTMPSGGTNVLIKRLKCFNCDKEFQETGSSIPNLV